MTDAIATVMADALAWMKAHEGLEEKPWGTNRVELDGSTLWRLLGLPGYDPDVKGEGGQPWCAGTVTYAYLRPGVDLRKLHGTTGAMYCPTIEATARRIGTWRTDGARPGDLVLFGNNGLAIHVGIADPAPGPLYYSIEGNGLPLDTPVLTGDGWRPIGDLEVGDTMVDPKGKPSTIQGIYPQGVRPCYRLTFGDGREIVADENHRWTVRRNPRSPWRVMTTGELVASGSTWTIPTIDVAPELDGDVDLPVDPWMIGALVGDGCLTRGPSLAASDPWMQQRAVEAVGEPSRVDRKDNSAHGYADGYTMHFPQIRDALADLDLLGHTWRDKHIPDAYMTAGPAQRRALLAGLLDSDGTCDTHGRASFASSNLALVEQVQDLVRSLGGTTGITTHHPTYTHLGTGEKRTGTTSYRASNIRLPFNPFTRPAKADRFRTMGQRRSVRGWAITNITPVDPIETVCISVTAPSQTYIAGDWLVTHNTSPGNEGSQANGGGLYRRGRPRSFIRGWVDMAKTLEYMRAEDMWTPHSAPVVAASAGKMATAAPRPAGSTSVKAPSSPARPSTAPSDYLARKHANDARTELVWGAFPLPAGHWYGVDDGGVRSHSGVRAQDSRAVRQVQRTAGVTADGVYGPRTRDAVARWQVAHGMVGKAADGEVGALTWSRMAA